VTATDGHPEPLTNSPGERLIVRCPHCSATFVVSQRVLEKAQGWALCGECFEPFDALRHAITPREKKSATPREPPLEPRAFQPEQLRNEPKGTQHEVSEPSPEPHRHSGSVAADVPPVRPLPPLPQLTRTRPSSLSILTGGLFLVLLTALALWQIALVAHAPILRIAPQLYPTWSEVCAKLGCQITPPADGEKLQIEAAHLIKESEPTRYTLELTLRNRATYPMPWPNLSVTLTDGLGRALVRKNIPPSEWGAPSERPFAAQERVGVILALQTVENGVVGFEVTPFYP